MTEKELIKLATKLESLAECPEDDANAIGPIELLSDLHKEAELNVDRKYTASLIHGILSELETLNG